jgi:hypothetical protein
MEQGHCVESVSMVHNSHNSTAKLVSTYFYYIKECIKKDFPKLPFMRSYMGSAAAKYGGFIDTVGEVVPLKRNAFIGNCNVSFTSSKYNIHLCWVRHESKLKVVATDHSHVHIDCFEDSSVEVFVASPSAKVTINQYGNSHVEVKGHVEQATCKLHDTETYK